MDNLIKFPYTAEVLAAYGSYIQDTYKANLLKNGHKATGKLVSSVHTVIKMGETNISVDMYLEDYYKYVEKGRNAGKRPPISKILEWIKIKPILPTPNEKGKLPSEESLAWAIATNMEKVGAPSKDGLPVEPTFDLERAKESADNNYWYQIEEALQKDLSDNFTSIMSLLMV